MAATKDNKELRRQALNALTEGRAEISAEIKRLREQLSPTRVLHRAVDRHTGLTLLIAVAAGTIPVLLIFGGKRSAQRAPRPIMITTNKAPSKPLISALLVGAFGVLAKAVTPALIKSVIVSPLQAFLDKKRS